jgi:hypothetical protein
MLLGAAAPDRLLDRIQSRNALERFAGDRGGTALGDVVEAGRRCALCRTRHKARARRKLFDVFDATASPLVKEALDRIGELFAIEATVNGRPPPERGSAARQRAAAPDQAA